MPLITPVDPNALTALDSLATAHGEHIAYDITDIVGVLVGLKPVAMIGNNSKAPDITTALVEKLGLKHASWPEKNLTYVSFNQENADRMAQLHTVVWGANAAHPDENREIGALLGYPVTATDYFIRRLTSFEAGVPLPIVEIDEPADSVSQYFCSLILSPEHAKEEISAYCKPLEEAVQEFAPTTYETFCALSSRS